MRVSRGPAFGGTIAGRQNCLSAEAEAEARVVLSPKCERSLVCPYVLSLQGKIELARSLTETFNTAKVFSAVSKNGKAKIIDRSFTRLRLVQDDETEAR